MLNLYKTYLYNLLVCLPSLPNIMIVISTTALCGLLASFVGFVTRFLGQPPTWRTMVFLFVWVIAFDLSGSGRPYQ